MRALVTGATGFIGQPLCRQLMADGAFVRASTRDAARPAVATETVTIPAIDGQTNWTAALRSIDTVFHLAAIAHVVDWRNRQAERYEIVNANGTERLAREAARAGVRRFVLLSSLKVNGEQSPPEGFHETDPVRPEDPYALSKMHAEQRLAEVGRASGLTYSIVRPPLVYGPRVRANFLALMHAVDRERPLPLASVRNCRSLIYVENLCSALRRVAVHERATSETFFVSDGEPLSVADLIRRIASALAKPPRLFPLPVAVLRAFAAVSGRGDAVRKLTASLVVDDHKIRTLLEWQPPHTLDQGLADTAVWYRESGQR